MSRAETTARLVRHGYYSRRQMDLPEDIALRIMTQARVRADTGLWLREEGLSAAHDTICSSILDVDELVEKDLRARLDVGDLSDFERRTGAPVFGAADPGQRRIVISERAERYMPLYRSTVAHELGHLLLHPGCRGSDSLNYAPSAHRRARIEVEADRFMVALLLPQPVLELAVSYVSCVMGCRLAEIVQRADTKRGRWQWRTKVLRPLVDHLCISRQMICIQLKARGIFTEDTYRFHLSYHLANKWLDSASIKAPETSSQQIMGGFSLADCWADPVNTDHGCPKVEIPFGESLL